MPKFVKGTYLLSLDEINKLVRAVEAGQVREIKGKLYVALNVEKKSYDIDEEAFREAITTFETKKAICEHLKTTYFKYQKYVEAKFGTDSISEIRNILANN